MKKSKKLKKYRLSLKKKRYNLRKSKLLNKKINKSLKKKHNLRGGNVEYIEYIDLTKKSREEYNSIVKKCQDEENKLVELMKTLSEFNRKRKKKLVIEEKKSEIKRIIEFLKNSLEKCNEYIMYLYHDYLYKQLNEIDINLGCYFFKELKNVSSDVITLQEKLCNNEINEEKKYKVFDLLCCLERTHNFLKYNREKKKI